MKLEELRVSFASNLTWTSLCVNFVNCYKELAPAFLGGELKWHRISSDKVWAMRYSRMSVCLFILEVKALLSGAALPAVLVCLMKAVCGAQSRLQCQGVARTSLSAAWSKARHSGQGSLSAFSPSEERQFRKGGEERKDCFTHQTAVLLCWRG